MSNQSFGLAGTFRLVTWVGDAEADQDFLLVCRDGGRGRVNSGVGAGLALRATTASSG